MPRPWSRRSVLVAAGLGCAAAVSTAVAGCGVRLEDDLPDLPLLPKRKPTPDEDALLELRREVGTLRGLALAVHGDAGSVPARLATVHASQLAVLEQVLRAGGVPLPTPTPSGIPSSTSTATATGRTGGTGGTGRTGGTGGTGRTRATGATGVTTTTAPHVSPIVQLRTAEAAASAPAALAALARATAANVALLGAVQAQRVAAVTLLGGATRWAPPAGPTGAAGARLLDATRAAAYGFEVVAAQGDRATRPLALATLASLQARAELLLTSAGPSAGPPALGYKLPFPVVTPAAARRLATHLLAGLLASCGTELAPLAGDEAGLTSLLRWTAETEVLAVRWGAALSPFPGLRTP